MTEKKPKPSHTLFTLVAIENFNNDISVPLGYRFNLIILKTQDNDPRVIVISCLHLAYLKILDTMYIHGCILMFPTGLFTRAQQQVNGVS